MYFIEVGFLFYLTFVINYLGLALALWLGLYLVTRNPKYSIAWLTALTLWSAAGMFLNILLALNPSPPAPFWPPWLRFLFPFWPDQTPNNEPSAWLQGWSVIPAIAFWHHATTLMRPGRISFWRWTRILVGYVVAVLAVVVQTNTPILFPVEQSDPLYLNTLRAGLWYPFFGIALLVLILACVINLLLTARATPASIPHTQVEIMITATLIAGLAGPLSLASSAYQIPIPIVVLSLAIGVPVGLIGYDVARYSAFMKGRTIRRDFFYNLALLVLVLLVYLLASWFLIQVYQAPAIMVVFIPILAILTHSLLYTSYHLMEPLLYHANAGQLRKIFQHLVSMAGEGEALEESLANALNALCSSIRATYGLILTCDDQCTRLVTTYHWHGGPVSLEREDITADDVLHLEAEQLNPPLEEAGLLVPLYANDEQIGALILGKPVNGVQYAPEDLQRLIQLSDQVANAIYVAQLKASYIRQIVGLAETQQRETFGSELIVPVETMEAALRHVYDFTYLADSPLAGMNLVRTRLTAGQNTHLDCGKMLHNVIIDAIEKLCPESQFTPTNPAREWYPYLILKEAYLEEVPNREIMARLYISEGTFNRTRRSAVRSLARALGEMETSLA